MLKKALFFIFIPALVILLPVGSAFAATCPTCDLAAKNLEVMQNRIEGRQQEIEEKKAQIQGKIEERKEALEVKKEEFRNRLTELKDKRKALVLQRVSKIIENINSRWCTHFKNVLSRLTAILSKVSTRSEKLTENGVSVAAVEAATDEAEAAIASAKVAVDEQCAKAYVVNLEDENALRSSAQDEIAALRSDLKATREVVFAARDAVHKAIQALRQAWAKSRPGEASESAEGE